MTEYSNAFIRQVLERFPGRIENTEEFARRNRVILITASNGCPADISMGLPGYMEKALEQSC
jgi:hypothetical protein